MTFYAFLLLSPVVQLYWVLHHGSYLAQRWDDESGVNLYHCKDEGRGFFVEVGIKQCYLGANLGANIKKGP